MIGAALLMALGVTIGRGAVGDRFRHVLHDRAGSHGRAAGWWRIRPPPDDGRCRPLRRRRSGSRLAVIFLVGGASSAPAQQTSGGTRRRIRQRSSPSRTMCGWKCSTGAVPVRPCSCLAGLSDTAHVFDDIAPKLAKRYRVVGVTRRGHPGSSAPATGYGFVRLAEDVVRVMDAVGLKNPVVVGHSFAGEEMHVLGARYPTRIAGLVYVDAAFDRADKFEAHEAAARALPGPPESKTG